MSVPDLEELERLHRVYLASTEGFDSPKDMSFDQLMRATKAEEALLSASAPHIPELIAAARERDELWKVVEAAKALQVATRNWHIKKGQAKIADDAEERLYATLDALVMPEEASDDR